ncbi:hypothetical protein SPOG_03791 [Schizosaccharomyces cryophilus OY26]|uniref:Uncharacterized protein n=1 Tax=Schizosaccharomyces cryophilus (strain OY26 / ATCC MYA-4695 / CBS 11777 / NBRC 106824 / NRRL Y48691) TaxID=653667 RepID=S9XHV8_SCHCR|nr:uncharacterized protein SPOG_03791 [Schizosaccharomyces cryophilus OY26]EPY53261.1 hypothetical protein SPOG_03791 [Schizosaccharomyces cryophilus OY26]
MLLFYLLRSILIVINMLNLPRKAHCAKGDFWRSKAELEASEKANEENRYRISSFWSVVTKMEDRSLTGLDGRYIVLDNDKLYLAPLTRNSEKMVFRFNLHHRGFLEIKSGKRAYIPEKYGPLIYHSDHWTNGFSIDVQKEAQVSSYTPFVLQYLNSPWFSACKVSPGTWQVFVGKMNELEHGICYPMQLIMKREDTWLRFSFSHRKNPLDWILVQEYTYWPDGKPGTGSESAKGSSFGVKR